jgi:excisionase family DNA binding protein
MSKPKLLTIKEVCEILQVSRATINRWMADKYISFVKAGKHVRFKPDYIEEWIEKKTIKAQKKIA